MREVKQISYNISKRNGAKIKYILIHDTANTKAGADAYAHYRYFNGGNRSSSADFFVDDKRVLCINDYYKYFTWHCGDGKGKYGITNSNSIGVEICINSDGDRQKAIENTIVLVHELMTELNIPIERVVRHYDASRKMCPRTMSANDWKEWYEFKERLQNKGELTMTQYEELKTMIKELSEQLSKKPIVFNHVKDVPEYAMPTIQKLCDKGYLKGDEKGDLSLDTSMIRTFVILDRAGAFDK